MPVITDAIIGGIAWEAFSKSITFYAEGVNDFALRIYIAQQLKSLKQLEGVSDKKIEKATNIIEATIVETPDEIKEIKNAKEQKEAFDEYVKNNSSIREITAKNYFEKIVVKDAGVLNIS